MNKKERKIKCPICGNGFLEDVKSDYETFVKDSGREIRIIVNNLGRKRCSNCKEDFLDDEALDRIQKEKYRKLDLLTPEELKIIRAKLGYTQEEMAELLSVGEKSYFRWENGLSIQNKSIDRYIRLVFENSARNIPFLKELQKQYGEKKYEREKVALYIENSQSIERQEEEERSVRYIGHEAKIIKHDRKELEKIIKKLRK